MQRLTFTCLILAMALGLTACVPILLGPTAPSGYFVALHATETSVWQEPPNPALDAPYPTSTRLTVRVQDAQGKPVDGVPVTFEVDPGWSEAVSFSPSRAITRNGQAHTVLRAFATGVVRVRARVENTTPTLPIAVYPPYSLREAGGNGL